MEPKWYFQIFLGAIAGFSLPYFIKFLTWPAYYLRSHILKGVWWEYYFSKIGDEIKVFESKKEIKIGFNGKLIYVATQEDTGLTYNGKVIVEKNSGQFITLGNGCNDEHDEITIKRYYFPLKSQRKIMTGITMSYTHDREPYSSSSILCEDRIGLVEAKKILIDIVEQHEGLPLIFVMRNAQLTSD